MVRRLFISLSIVALAALCLLPSAAANAQNPTSNARMPLFPEPQPMVLDDASVEQARGILEAVARGTLDRSELAAPLDLNVSPAFLAKGAAFVSALGPPRSMFAFEKRLTADATSTYFRVRYPNEILTWIVSVNSANQITGLWLRRSESNIVFGIGSRKFDDY